VIELPADRQPAINAEGGRAFAAFVTSAQGQDIIAAFGRWRGGAAQFEPARGVEPR